MTYDPRSRDRHRLAVAFVTGLTSISALSASGWVAGLAATDYQDELGRETAQRRAEEAKANAEYEADVAKYEAALQATQGKNVIWKKRRIERRVSVRYVRAAGGGTAQWGGSSAGGGSGAGISGGGGGGGGNSSGGGGGKNPAPPPPPPPPAPSSGS